MKPNTEERKLAAIMFTDMVGYSALSQRDDKLAQELLEEHRRLLEIAHQRAERADSTAKRDRARNRAVPSRGK